jgi:hypothetical protein
MKTLKLGLSYLSWHYSQAFVDIYHNSKTLLWFVYYFFSLPILLKTFFAPWKRMDMEKPDHEHMSDKLGRLLINTLMRLIGMFLRTIFILIGLAVMAGLLFAEVSFILLWVVLPVLIVAMLIKGIMLVL